MKKRMSMFICLTLTVLLISSMTLPAMAISYSDTYDGYSYTWSITQTATAGKTTISLPSKPTYVRAKVTCKVYDDLNKKTRYPSSDITGYPNATAIASHIIDISEEDDPNPIWVRGTIQYTTGSAWIGGFPVAENVYVS